MFEVHVPKGVGVQVPLVAVFLILFSVSASAASVSKQSLTAKILPKTLKCTDGTPGEHPVSLEIQYVPTAGAIVESKDAIVFNTTVVSYRGKPEDKCPQFEKILNAEKPIEAKLVKEITERPFLRKDNHRCQRDVMETVTLSIENLKFTGGAGFVVYPAPAKECGRKL